MRIQIFSKRGIRVFLEKKNSELKINAEGLLAKIAKPIIEAANEMGNLNKYIMLPDGKIFLTSLIPLIPSRPFERFVDSQIKRLLWRAYTPENVSFLVTSKCQCRCVHCIAHGIDGSNELSAREISDVISEALEMGAYQICFEGGEPTLREDLPDLIRLVDKEKAITRVVTNGLLLTEDYIQELYRAGLTYLNVSLDSPHPEVHNKIRGHDVFHKAVEGIELAVKKGIVTSILYVVSPFNSDYQTIITLYKLAEKLRAHEILIDEIAPTGRWSTHSGEVLTDSDYTRLQSIFDELNNRNGPRITSLLHLRRLELVGCFAGRRWLFISPNGEVMPCTHIPISFGNIREEGLREIWGRIRRHKLFRSEGKTCVWRDNEYRTKYFTRLAKTRLLPLRIEKIESDN